MRVNSLNRPPRTAESAAAILAEARLRLELAATEYAASLDYWLRLCQNANGYCWLLGPDGFLDTWLERIRHAISAVESTAQREVEVLLALGDRVSPYEYSPGAYSEALWSTSDAAPGYRERAARVLYGGPVEIEQPPGSRYWPMLDFPASSLVDYQGESFTNPKVLLVKALMIRHNIPVPNSSDALMLNTDGVETAFSLDRYARSAFVLLDERLNGRTVGALTADEFMGLESSFSDWNDLEPTVLHRIHGISPSHVAEAARWITAAPKQVDVLYSAEQPFVDGSQYGQVSFHSLANYSQWQRSEQYDALTRGLSGYWYFGMPNSHSWLLEEGGGLYWRDHSQPVSNYPWENWYSLDRRRFEQIGTIGALHTLRVALIRVAALAQLTENGRNWESWSGQEARDIVATLDLLVGSRYAERLSHVRPWGALEDGDYRGRIIWWRRGDNWPAEGRPVYVLAPAKGPSLPRFVNELRRGVANYRPAPMDDSEGVFESPTGELTAHYEIPYEAILDETNVDVSHAYILWERCEAPEGIADADIEVSACNYELVDHFSIWENGVHVFGGKLGRLMQQVAARDPKNPVAPLYNSFGRARYAMPRLDPSFIRGEVSLEEAWDELLKRTLQNAMAVKEQLAGARTIELSRLEKLAEIESAHDFDEATVEQLEREHKRLAANLCTTEGSGLTCDVTFESYTLGRLGVVSPPTEPVLDCGYYPEKVASPTTYSLNKLGLEALERDIDCAQYHSSYQSSNLALKKLPVRVVEEWNRAEVDAGAFGDIRGEMQTEFQTIYQGLKSMELAYEQFEFSVSLAKAGTKGAKKLLGIMDLDNDLAEQCLGIGRPGLGLTFPDDVVEMWLEQRLTGAEMALDARERDLHASGAENCLRTHGLAYMGEEKALLREYVDIYVGVQGVDMLFEQAQALSRLVAQSVARIEAIQSEAELLAADFEARKKAATEGLPVSEPGWQAVVSAETTHGWQQFREVQLDTFKALRLLEFRLGENLENLGEDWASDLYALSATVHGAGSDEAYNSSAGEALVAYVTQLGRFAETYLCDRYIQTEGYDSQTLFLKRLLKQELDNVGGTNEDEPEFPFWTQLPFKCRNHEGLLRGGGAELRWDDDYEEWVLEGTKPCDGAYGGVEYAVANFSVPIPLQGYVAERLLSSGFNYRIETFALNLLNSDSMVLFHSEDPEVDCESSMRVKYEMQQGAATAVENYGGDVKYFSLLPVSTQGWALAKGRQVHVPREEGDPDLTGLLRHQFRGRPLGAEYTIKLEGHACLDWTALDDIQIWLDYSYWEW
jgi:hypothetical protein